MDPVLMDQKIVILEKKLFLDPIMRGLSGSIGDEKIETSLKTMSDGGGLDKQMADGFEKWLVENKVEHSRTDYRHFRINTVQLFEVLKNL